MFKQNPSSNFYVPRTNSESLFEQLKNRDLGVKGDEKYKKNYNHMGIFSNTRLANIYWRYREQYYPKGLPTIQ